MTTYTYIFSKPTSSKLSKPYYRACPLLKMFSRECGANIPESLRGTTLRKHIATYTSLLNVEEASIDTLANFMGHHKDIHKNIYRVPPPVKEMAILSKLLMSAVGNEEDVDGEESDDESNASENCEANDNLSQQKQRSLNSSSSSKKRRSSKLQKKRIFIFFILYIDTHTYVHTYMVLKIYKYFSFIDVLIYVYDCLYKFRLITLSKYYSCFLCFSQRDFVRANILISRLRKTLTNIRLNNKISQNI